MEDKKRYLVWINNLIIKNEQEEYDFLYEMYPNIKELYNILWYIKHNSMKPFDQITLKKIKRLENEIKTKLQIYGIPEYILIIEDNDNLIEPISGQQLSIVEKSIKLRNVGYMAQKIYIDNLNIPTVNFLNEKLVEFNQNIESYSKRK